MESQRKYKYYEYGGPKFTGYYYKKELGWFRLTLLCLRRALFYTGGILKFCATDIFYIYQPSHPIEQEPLLKRMILTVMSLISLAGVLSVPGIITGLYLGQSLLTECAFGILATIAALAWVTFLGKFIKSCTKYMRENSGAVKQIFLKPCKCKRGGKVHFHQINQSDNNHDLTKNINIDLNYIPRSLVVEPEQSK